MKMVDVDIVHFRGDIFKLPLFDNAVALPCFVISDSSFIFPKLNRLLIFSKKPDLEAQTIYVAHIFKDGHFVYDVGFCGRHSEEEIIKILKNLLMDSFEDSFYGLECFHMKDFVRFRNESKYAGERIISSKENYIFLKMFFDDLPPSACGYLRYIIEVENSPRKIIQNRTASPSTNPTNVEELGADTNRAGSYIEVDTVYDMKGDSAAEPESLNDVNQDIKFPTDHLPRDKYAGVSVIHKVEKSQPERSYTPTYKIAPSDGFRSPYEKAIFLASCDVMDEIYDIVSARDMPKYEILKLVIKTITDKANDIFLKTGLTPTNKTVYDITNTVLKQLDKESGRQLP